MFLGQILAEVIIFDRRSCFGETIYILALEPLTRKDLEVFFCSEMGPAKGQMGMVRGAHPTSVGSEQAGCLFYGRVGERSPLGKLRKPRNPEFL
jgi:hypothetical protein